MQVWVQIRGVAVLAILLAIATPDRALATYVCTVQPSPDGFVALRAKPSADGEILAKGKEGEALVIQQRANGDWIEDGSWVQVFHFPGEVIPEKEAPDYNLGRVGWMHRRYVSDCG
jgi:hypothetical protein